MRRLAWKIYVNGARGISAFLAGTLTFGSTVSAEDVQSPLDLRADSIAQMSAAALVPALRGRRLYADDGLMVGFVSDVRVSQDGHSFVAVVSRRRWLGGGKIVVAVPLLRQQNNELTISSSRENIRAMPRM